MQATPDKDFDQAFQQKFEAFEVQPSAAVWKAIASELDGGKKKKSFPLIQIMAAASILIVLGTGLVLFSPKEHVRLQGKAEETVVQQGIQTEEAAIQGPQQAVEHTRSERKAAVIPQAETKKDLPALPEVREVQTVASVQEAPKPAEYKAAAKDVELTKQDNQLENKGLAAISKPALAFTGDQVTNADTGRYLTSQRRSRNGAGILGSVVNYVVGKVDPREDKLIQFSNDEDGGNEISGINLGVLKMKKQNR